ncbi:MULTISPECIES: hydroxyectoine utilization dehydratase EutB [Pseudomonas]|jgi:threonine dehydratase|uniref:hydroxyectoine utilization dehydratase EutB n=1 Tax=Pseudomonas TaxID=286 RepID=UPI0005708075|nr:MULTISPECIES: hydroxyectoine utilization dehydratase EutB [Pseudomonas]MCE0963261.1 hydroxyectoine utilization dehydratase EutB [Pseudomonas putida]QPN44331.1 hydroxyectoine utilization dehydratase EutB [Priestia aryabhattai]QUN69023.1 hydroxyectoine utilization dehydratase EutB [Pseudomonas sp. JS425]
MPAVTVREALIARERIKHLVRETRMELSPSLSDFMRVPVYLKLECHQATGSFKLRGATNAIAGLTSQQRALGVVTASTGNHGRALSYAAAAAGVRATVCLSRLVPSNKVAAIRALGAAVQVVGNSQDDAQFEAARLAQEEGLTFIPPFDHQDVIAGQATLGLEIAEQLPSVSQVLIPLSGGGLFSGVSLALKALLPQVKTHGVSMRLGAAMAQSLEAGKPVNVEEVATLADSLGGGVGLRNQYTFELTRRLIDRVILLNEGSIADAMLHAYLEERLVIEGAGAVGIAALLTRQVEAQGPIVIVVSGGNVDMAQHQRIILEAVRDRRPARA